MLMRFALCFLGIVKIIITTLITAMITTLVTSVLVPLLISIFHVEKTREVIIVASVMASFFFHTTFFELHQSPTEPDSWVSG